MVAYICKPQNEDAEFEEDPAFKASLGYIARPCLKNKQTNKKEQ
jgi:hypothetical protein